MNEDACEKQEVLLQIKEKLLLAEERRLSNVPTISLEDVFERLVRKIASRS